MSSTPPPSSPYLHGEPGGETVEDLFGTSAISSVNWSEVIQKALEKKTKVEGLRRSWNRSALRSFPSPPSWQRRPLHLRAETRYAGLPSGTAPASHSQAISVGPL